jgi:hypothetical protein
VLLVNVCMASVFEMGQAFHEILSQQHIILNFQRREDEQKVLHSPLLRISEWTGRFLMHSSGQRATDRSRQIWTLISPAVQLLLIPRVSHFFIISYTIQRHDKIDIASQPCFEKWQIHRYVNAWDIFSMDELVHICSNGLFVPRENTLKPLISVKTHCSDANHLWWNSRDIALFTTCDIWNQTRHSRVEKSAGVWRMNDWSVYCRT